MASTANPDPPRRSCLIATSPRTGSWLLSDLLSKTDLVGRPDEYFRLDFAKEIARDLELDTKGLSRAYLEGIVAGTATADGVFSAKIHPHHFDRLLKALRAAERDGKKAAGDGDDEAAMVARWFPDPRYVYLKRRDHRRQAISYWRALQSGVWWSFAPGPGRRRVPRGAPEGQPRTAAGKGKGKGPGRAAAASSAGPAARRPVDRPADRGADDGARPDRRGGGAGRAAGPAPRGAGAPGGAGARRVRAQPEVTPDWLQIKWLEDLVVAYEANWNAYFERSGITPYEVVYEEMVEDPDATVRGVLEFLGIALPAGFTVPRSRVERLSDATTERWLEAYGELRDRLPPMPEGWGWNLFKNAFTPLHWEDEDLGRPTPPAAGS